MSVSQSGCWPVLGSPEDADATFRWARECLEMWETERARYREALEGIEEVASGSTTVDPLEMNGRLLSVILLARQALREGKP
jgi:hypothetical protein